MKLGSALAALALVIVTGPPDAVAFSPSLSSTGTSKYQYWTTTTTTSSPSSSSTNLMMARNNQPSKDDDNNNNNVNNPLVNFCATAAMTAMLWGSPTIMAQQAYSHSTSTTTSTTTTTAVQQMLYDTSAANAKEMASGTGSRVNKDAESLLRLGLPFKNKEVRYSIVVIHTRSSKLQKEKAIHVGMTMILLNLPAAVAAALTMFHHRSVPTFFIYSLFCSFVRLYHVF